MVDPDTGVEAWTLQTAPRSLNAGPVLSHDGRTAWLVGTAGLLVEIDLVAGAVGRRRQLFTANTFSTPVLLDDLLVVGSQDGSVYGVDVG